MSRLKRVNVLTCRVKWRLMETEAVMETQATPEFFLAALDGDAETVRKTVQLRIVQVVKMMQSFVRRALILLT